MKTRVSITWSLKCLYENWCSIIFVHKDIFISFLIITSMHTDGWLVVWTDFQSSFNSVTDKSRI